MKATLFSFISLWITISVHAQTGNLGVEFPCASDMDDTYCDSLYFSFPGKVMVIDQDNRSLTIQTAGFNFNVLGSVEITVSDYKDYYEGAYKVKKIIRCTQDGLIAQLPNGKYIVDRMLYGERDWFCLSTDTTFALPNLKSAQKVWDMLGKTRMKELSNKNKVQADQLTDRQEASFVKIGDSPNEGTHYKTTEVNYKIAFISPEKSQPLTNYIARSITCTDAYTGKEVQQRKISVLLTPLDNPSGKVINLEHDCDELILDNVNYKTTQFGCCGADNKVALYDYDGKNIISGDEQILTANIPNAHIYFYLAFVSAPEDSPSLGTLYMSYSSTEKDSIVIPTSAIRAKDCTRFAPRITVNANNPKDKYEPTTNTVSLWSIDTVRDRVQINNVNIQLQFDCDSEGGNTLTIPVINGHPVFSADTNSGKTRKGTK